MCLPPPPLFFSSPADFSHSGEDAAFGLGDLSEELSAKVAELQAALAEMPNVGGLDPDTLARLEETYASSSEDEDEDDATRAAKTLGGASSSAATKATKTKAKAKAKAKSATLTDASTANATGIATGVDPAKKKARGRPRASRTRAGGLTTRRARPGDAAAEAAASSRRRAVRASPGGKQSDSMKTYLKDIGTVSLLTPEEEIELAKRIQDLMYLDGVRATLAEEKGGAEPSAFEWACAANVEVRELEFRLEEGKRAKNEMIQANLRLVVSIAKRYANKSMSFQDLIQEGCVGLIRGAEKFDFKRGYKFSTYAHWWIRQAVTRSISDQSRTIRLPVHLFEIISRMSKLERSMAQSLGREPTTEELAEAMDMTAEKIKQIKKASLVPISLNQTVNEDDKRTVEETLIDDHTEHPDDATGKVLLKEDLENVLNTLNPRERDVLRLRYGLDDGRVKTLEEIGNVFSVTRERIRQIEAKALRKLRQPSRNGVLREYLPTDHESQIDVA